MSFVVVFFLVFWKNCWESRKHFRIKYYRTRNRHNLRTILHGKFDNGVFEKKNLYVLVNSLSRTESNMM